MPSSTRPFFFWKRLSAASKFGPKRSLNLPFCLTGAGKPTPARESIRLTARTSFPWSKYLAKWKKDGSCEVTETVLAAGRSYLNYVNRN